MLTVLSRIAVKGSTLPPLLKTGKDVYRTYPSEIEKTMNEMLEDFGRTLKDEYKQTLTPEKYADEMYSTLFPSTIDYSDPEVIQTAQQVYDSKKLNSKMRAAGLDKQTYDMWFWSFFASYYRSLKQKQASQQRKQLELEQKLAKQKQKEQQKQQKIADKKKFTKIDNVFDQGDNDVIWKFLTEHKRDTLDFLNKIRHQFDQADDLFEQERALDIKDKVKVFSKKMRYNPADVQLALLPSSTQRDVLQNDIEVKYADFLRRIVPYVGNEIENVNLFIGRDGNLNGTVVGQKGSCKVQTINAFGPIQRPHFRVLVKRL